MTRRRLVVFAALTLLLVVPTAAWWGYIRSSEQHFYRMRSTRQWSRIIKDWAQNAQWSEPLVDRALAFCGLRRVADGPAVLDLGDPGAERVLLDLLADGDVEVREVATQVLHAAAHERTLHGRVPLERDLLRAFMERLRDPDAGIRAHAAEVMMLAGPTAAEAVPALVTLLDDPDQRVRSTAGMALLVIDPKTAEALIK